MSGNPEPRVPIVRKQAGEPGAFLAGAGFVLDEGTGTRVTGHIELGPRHHTPWGIVHGGVYTTAIESAATLGASAAVHDRGMVPFGLTNTTHFFRSLTSGTVALEAGPLSQGRTQQLWWVEITDSNQWLIAHGEVRLQNIDSTAL